MIEQIKNIEKKEQISLAIDLIEIALPIWENYVKVNPIEYQDSVIGLWHEIDNRLIETSILLSRNFNNQHNFLMKLIMRLKIKSLLKKISEPVVARQDDDYEIPSDVELVLFSAFNLIEYMLGDIVNYNNENRIYISINQSFNAITKSGIMNDNQLKLIIKSKIS